MTTRPLLLAGLLVSLSACHFDGTSYNEDFGDDENSDNLGIPDPNQPDDVVPDPSDPDGDLSKRYFATSESTVQGSVMSGSFRSLDSMDGSSEVLTGAINSFYENLEQRWHFTNVPSGQHELTFVAQAYSPRDLERFTIAYRIEGQEQWTNVLLLRPGTVPTAHVNRVDVPTTSNVEFRALLTPDAPALVEVVSEIGVSSFQLIELVTPGEEGGPDLEDVVPLRSLRVDYVGLRQRDQISN